MNITELRKEIKDLAPNILEAYGFDQVGELGEFIKTENNGNKFAILIDEIKYKNSFSISIRVLAYYKIIEDLFKKVIASKQYTINIYLAAKSIGINDLSRSRVESILKNLISIEAVPFFERYCSDESVLTNLNSSNYQDWITSDKLAQFKIKLASAALNKNTVELEKVKIEALDYCTKHGSVPDREIIQELCTCI